MSDNIKSVGHHGHHNARCGAIWFDPSIDLETDDARHQRADAALFLMNQFAPKAWVDRHLDQLLSNRYGRDHVLGAERLALFAAATFGVGAIQ